MGAWTLLFVVGGLLAVDGELIPGNDSIDVLDPATTTEVTRGEDAESARADRLLEEKLRGPEPTTEILIIQSDSVTVDTPEFQAKVDDTLSEIEFLGSDVATLVPEVGVSADRRTATFPLLLSADFAEAVEDVEDVLEVVREADDEEGYRVLVVGEASIAHEHTEISESDLRRGEAGRHPDRSDHPGSASSARSSP